MPASSTKKAATSKSAAAAAGSTCGRCRPPEAALAARWFDKVSSRLDKMPLFGEALAAAALAWSDSLAALSGAAPVFSFAGLADTKVAGLLRRRGADPVFAVLDAPGWSTQVGLQFDRAFVSTVVEALFGGADEGVRRPASPMVRSRPSRRGSRTSRPGRPRRRCGQGSPTSCRPPSGS